MYSVKTENGEDLRFSEKLRAIIHYLGSQLTFKDDNFQITKEKEELEVTLEKFKVSTSPNIIISRNEKENIIMTLYDGICLFENSIIFEDNVKVIARYSSKSELYKQYHECSGYDREWVDHLIEDIIPFRFVMLNTGEILELNVDSIDN